MFFASKTWSHSLELSILAVCRMRAILPSFSFALGFSFLKSTYIAAFTITNENLAGFIIS